MFDRTNKYNYLSLKFYFVEFYFWSILLNLTIDINGCSASIQVTVRVVLQCSAMVVELSISPFNSSPCPLLIPRACSNSCPLSQWCHPTISSSVIPFSSRLQSFPASESFQMSQFFTSGGQSIGVSASASWMNIQDWFPLGWTGWISLQSKRLSRVFSNTTVQKHQFFGAQLSL